MLVVVDAANEAKVEQRELTVVGEQHVPFVRVSVHESGAKQLRGRTLHSHLDHELLLFQAERLHRSTLNPLLREHLLRRHVRVVPRDEEVVQKSQRLSKLIRVARLDCVIELLKDPGAYLVDNLVQILRAVEPGFLHPTEPEANDVQIQRDPPRHPRSLHLHRHLTTIMQPSSVHLPDARRRDGLRAQFLVQTIRRSRLARVSLANRAVPTQLSLNDRVRLFRRKRPDLILQHH